MSTPESRTTVSLGVTGASGDAVVVVYDAGNHEVARQTGAPQMQMSLPRGFYTLRVNVGADFGETFIRLNADTAIPAPMPARYSPAPLADGALTHEYYSQTSAVQSREKTRDRLTVSSLPPAELFLFVRALDRERYKGADFGRDLQLLNDKGERITGFAADVTKRDTEVGWLAFCAEAAPGFYRLAVGGQRPREIAVHLFPNWQTQLFVLHHGRPLVESLRVFMSPVNTGFEPYDEIADAVDAGLSALQSGSAFVPEATLELFLHNKFQNPMLGFIGGHLLIRAARAEPHDSPERNRRAVVMREVLGNLDWLAPAAPDTVALEILAHREFGLPLERASAVSLPPMLRAGYSAIVAAAADTPPLIPRDSLCDDISDRLLSDSPWTSWEPRPAGRGLRTTSGPSISGRRMPLPSSDSYTLGPAGEGGGGAVNIPELIGAVVGGLMELPSALAERWPWRARVPEIGWLERAVIDEVLRAQRSGTLTRDSLDPAKIARDLGVSPHAVLRTIESLSRATLEKVLAKAEVDAALRSTIGGTWKHLSNVVRMDREPVASRSRV
jgi:hypothetical protein